MQLYKSNPLSNILIVTFYILLITNYLLHTTYIINSHIFY